MSNSTNEPSIGLGYELMDFGDGRKLESFGGRVLDRPCPAAQWEHRRDPRAWQHADAVFCDQRRRWNHRKDWIGNEFVQLAGFQMPIAPTPFGHIGVFPEQRDNWNWLSNQAAECASDQGASDKGLNLFGYTGAGTVAMAMAGLNVAHVDAARKNVSIARRAAQLNGFDEHPIRYLVDDAAKFVAREKRRGNVYRSIIMDPPAYGHSPSGQTWRLERDLWPLLDDCLSILSRHRFQLLITGHSPQVGADDVVDYLSARMRLPFGMEPSRFERCIESGRLSLIDRYARRLDAGFYVRCSDRPSSLLPTVKSH